MPYIDAKARNFLAPEPRCDAQNSGELNYQITVLCDEYLGQRPNYARINEVIGVLECAKLELYRRVAAPYENRKWADNGDVYTERKDHHT